MLLAIDVGNTNITLGLVQGETIISSRRASSRAAMTADELEAIVDSMLRLDGATIADVSGISLASVVPVHTAAASQAAERRGLPILVAGFANMPMPVRVARPSEVGADRLVNALAVARLYGTPAIVVDFGTATTFDCVSRDGSYVGGAIAPGPQLGLDALASRTARLPHVDLVEPQTAIGTDTATAMQAGVVLGYRALTAGLLQQIRAELARAEKVDPREIQIVLTGGLSAGPWTQGLSGVDAIDPDLTLKGLGILWAIVTGEPEVPGQERIAWDGSAAGTIHVITEPEG